VFKRVESSRWRHPGGPASDRLEAALHVQVLDRAFAILRLFTELAPTWSLSEIARALTLKTSTAYRTIRALKREGYLGRDESSKRYHLGMAALELGSRAQKSMALTSPASNALRWLSFVTGETAFLIVLSEDRRYSVCIDRIEGNQPLRLTVDPGRRIPIHAGSGQKVLLAYMPERDVETILAGPLPRLSKNTITNPALLRSDLAGIRDRGWSISFEETEEGTWAMAIPILDATGHAAAAVAVAGPVLRRSAQPDDLWLRECRRAAVSVADSLGLHVPVPVL
jgi:DNA-binding IclR family transcriptional regulator